MKYTAIIVALLVAVGMAFADQVTDNRSDLGPKVAGPDGANPVTIRTGGETIELATPIASLPYSDMASTVGAINNYDEVCPYTGSLSPDVVYSYAPGTNQIIDISLCNSYYDTKVFVYKDSYTPGAPYACNDDYCSGPNYPYSYCSFVTISVDAGHTYYIVVDGYGSASGTYVLDVSTPVVCDVTCPPGAQLENEPICGTNYVDSWNGGCNSTPYVFQPLCPPAGATTATLCGESGTYTYFGYSYRDTDWFTCYGTGGLMTMTVCADFPVQLILIYGTDCLYPTYIYTTAAPYVAASLSYVVGSGSYAWIWVGPSVFYGVPCGSNYILTMDGITTGPDCPVDATEPTSWGAIKSLYR